MKKPKDLKDVVATLWVAVFGLNERDGLLHMTRELWDWMTQRKALPLWTRDEHEKFVAEQAVRDAESGRVKKEDSDSARMNGQQIAGLIIQAVIGLATILTVLLLIKNKGQ